MTSPQALNAPSSPVPAIVAAARPSIRAAWWAGQALSTPTFAGWSSPACTAYLRVYNAISDEIVHDLGLALMLLQAFPTPGRIERSMTVAIGDGLRVTPTADAAGHGDGHFAGDLTAALLCRSPGWLRSAFSATWVQTWAADLPGASPDLIFTARPCDVPRLRHLGVPVVLIGETKYLANGHAPCARRFESAPPSFGYRNAQLFGHEHDLANGRAPRTPHRRGPDCRPFHHTTTRVNGQVLVVTSCSQYDVYVAHGPALLRGLGVPEKLLEHTAQQQVLGRASLHALLVDVRARAISPDLTEVADRMSSAPTLSLLAVAAAHYERLSAAPSRQSVAALQAARTLLLRLLFA